MTLMQSPHQMYFSPEKRPKKKKQPTFPEEHPPTMYQRLARRKRKLDRRDPPKSMVERLFDDIDEIDTDFIL